MIGGHDYAKFQSWLETELKRLSVPAENPNKPREDRDGCGGDDTKQQPIYVIGKNLLEFSKIYFDGK